MKKFVLRYFLTLALFCILENTLLGQDVTADEIVTQIDELKSGNTEASSGNTKVATTIISDDTRFDLETVNGVNLSIEQNLDGKGNEAYVLQIGSRNEGSDVQKKQDGSDQNLIKVMQMESKGLVHGNQFSELNQTASLQEGNDKVSSVDVPEYDNTFPVKQEGKRNVIDQDLTNAADLHLQLEQQGNDNQVADNQNILSNRQIIVKQVGDGMNLQINQSSSN